MEQTEAIRKTTKLGEILLGMGAIEPARLAEAEALARSRKLMLADLLSERQWVDPDAMGRALAKEAGKPFADLTKIEPTNACAAAFEKSIAHSLRAVAFGRDDSGVWQVACADPMDPIAAQALRRAVKGGNMALHGGSALAIRQAVERIYSNIEAIGALSTELSKEFGGESASGPAEDQDSAVARLLQSIFDDAAAKRASDIHIEPFEDKLVFRMRVDGSLLMLHQAPPAIAGPVVQRLKILASLDIGERRAPQDGRFSFQTMGRTVDARLATTPLHSGEGAVVRLLSGSGAIPSLESLGWEPEDLSLVEAALAEPHGLIILTGPTGSGKTTTLYSALGRLNKVETKIVTIEDPVEARIPGATQQQVHEKIGLGFPAMLRSTLRQDPDVILVGEMRDGETAETAMRAALTGHLVLSTLHTNDAKGAATRLEDMGAERFIIASTLRLAVAQRLIRLACPRCSHPCPISARESAWLEKAFDGKGVPAGAPVASKGCPHCSNTGFYGRRAIHEVLAFDEELVEILQHGTRKEFSVACERRLAGRRLSARAATLALRGVTSVAEAQKASGGST